VWAGEDEGDVRKRDWKTFKGRVDVVHGGPPCQPFSIAGQQQGRHDDRNMWGAFIDVIHAVKPSAFIAENVKGLLDSKFQEFVQHEILDPLSDYSITSFCLNAAGFGVPQGRERVFFVGFKQKKYLAQYRRPQYTYSFDHLLARRSSANGLSQLSLLEEPLERCMGVREALGLPDIGVDILAPTIRSGFTGKRNTTSIINSTASVKHWASIEVWANGVAATRQLASIFPTENGHVRLSVQDCGVLQGFPESWEFCGAVYQVLGQIGNSVAPPVAYQVAKSVADALRD
jgi:DNA (cytosine-5)-methyltransferase 1